MNKIIISILIIFTILGFGIFKVRANNSEKEQVMQDKKVLVAYFSWGGNTKSIAEKIHAKVGGDLLSIEPATPYPNDYNETAYGIAKEQHEKNIHPEIKNTEDISNYDVIFVGTPAWWYTMAPPVMTFLEKNNFNGKTIIPFITHGGGGQYTIAKDMENLAKGSKVLTPFVVYERGDNNTNKELDKWLNEIK